MPLGLDMLRTHERDLKRKGRRRSGRQAPPGVYREKKMIAHSGAMPGHGGSRQSVAGGQ